MISCNLHMSVYTGVGISQALQNDQGSDWENSGYDKGSTMQRFKYNRDMAFPLAILCSCWFLLYWEQCSAIFIQTGRKGHSLTIVVRILQCVCIYTI